MAPTAGTRLRFKKAAAKKPAQVKKLPSLKNRIRGLERFLNRGEIPDATRRAKKAELEQLKKEHEEKERVELEKKNAEKYKKPRFFERVKIMRKLRQAKKHMESATNKAEAKKHKADYERYCDDMKYIYFYPRAEPYLSLFPSKPLSEEELARQQQLRQEAIERFEKEQPTEAFHQFCFNDGKSADQQARPAPAASLLMKRPSKEEAKKHKKPRKNRDKSAATPTPALVDMEEDELEVGVKSKEDKQEEQEEDEEEDDFFL